MACFLAALPILRLTCEVAHHSHYLTANLRAILQHLLYEDVRDRFDGIGEIYSLSAVTPNFNMTRRSFPIEEALALVVKEMGIKTGQWQEISY
jgi:hypothetical protein